jgi:hypothetical protein
MRNFKSHRDSKALCAVLAGAILSVLVFAGNADAQSYVTIDAGTTITVRINEDINSSNGDGRVFSGVVSQDVVNRAGSVAIPERSQVELMVRNIGNYQVALDLESIQVGDQRYSIQTDDSVGAQRGTSIGAIIGAMTGGGRGAAGAQILTRGRSVNVPAESLITFRLQRPLRVGAVDRGFADNGQHFHPGYNTNSGNTAAYQDGLRLGRMDFERHIAPNARSSRWTSGQQLSDFQAGYQTGYEQAANASNELSVTPPEPRRPMPPPPPRLNEGICVYDRPNYQGREQCWAAGTDLSDLGRTGNWNDQISSIRVLGRVRVTVFRDIHFQAQSLVVDHDIPNLAQFGGQGFRNWDRQISSIRF